MSAKSNNKRSVARSESNKMFSEIFVLEDIQRLQNLFSDANGVASVITDPDGIPLTKPSNFCKLCTMIRRTDIGLANCIKSDAFLGNYQSLDTVVQRCLSGGLWDASAKIIVGGKHIANWMIGQVRNEELDELQIIKYADEIGVDRQEFTEAFNEVTIMPIEQFDRVSKMLSAFANELSEKAFRNLQLKKQIAENEKATMLLKESEERFKILFDNAPLGYQSLDFNGNFIEVNQQWLNSLGYSREEVIGKWFGDFLSPAYQNGFRERFPIFKTNGRIHSEFEMVHKNGNKLFVAFEGMIGYDLRGEFKQTHCILQDITERKLAEKLISENERKFRNLVETTNDVIWETNLEGLYTYVSPQIEKILGYRPEELIGHSPFELISSDELVEISKKSDEIVSEGKPFDALININMHKDGHGIIFETSGVPVHDANNNLVGYRGINRDITDRVRAEDEILLLNAELEQRVKLRTLQLENANRELEAFSYSVAHNLRSPLRGIDGWSFALLQDYNHLLDNQGRIYINRIRREAQHMGNLIDDLLKLSQVTHIKIVETKVNISLLVQTIVDQFTIAHPSWQFEFIIEPGLFIESDISLLQIVLNNLIENAFKFTGLKKVAKIEFGKKDIERKTVFYIRDNGVGFSMEYANKLFRPFQRLHKPSDFQGSGIGLATVHRILSRLGGRIWAESSPGEGATFYFATQ
jgi:PAS domain S-box-containing protein